MDGSSPPSTGSRGASLAELEAQITELAGQLNAAQYRWLMLIAEFDRRKGWSDGRLPSCARWLNFKCGLNLGAAREKVRVAHALAGLPKIAALRTVPRKVRQVKTGEGGWYVKEWHIETFCENSQV